MRSTIVLSLLVLACSQKDIESGELTPEDGGPTPIDALSSPDAGTASQAGTTDACDVDLSDSYYPLVDGARWTYRHREGSDIRLETVSVVTMGDQYLLTDEASNGKVVEGTLERRGCAVFRVRKLVTQDDEVVLDVDYDPGFLRMDDTLTDVGDELVLQYDRRAVSTDGFGDQQIEENCSSCGPEFPPREHRFVVEEVGADCPVGEQMFECIVVRRERIEAGELGETKRFWFARGVGKVRETQELSGKIEELLEFDLPGL